MNKDTKFIFVTGGVVSSLGKGISASSIGQLLKLRGLKVFMQKFDPYINVDPGQMSPFQHGEVFVTDDGAETDLDLGHYERFIDVNLNKYSSVTAGKIYKWVIERERRREYGGITVQVVPHITDEIKKLLKKAADYSDADIIITEIGGTVGDIESLPFLEAIRQCKREFGANNTLYVHNTLVPFLKTSNEVKTKPTQHSVRNLMSLGISPDLLILRTEVELDNHIMQKISSSCDVEVEGVIQAIDVDVIFECIIKLHKQKTDDFILKKLNILNTKQPNLEEWENLIKDIKETKKSINIGLVGKYVSLHDAYLSVNESLKHAGFKNKVKINIKWIDSNNLTEKNIKDALGDVDGIILPGGFGEKATNGIITAARYGRENNIPTFGICYGMQMMALEFAKNYLKLEGANTKEIDRMTKHSVITDVNDIDKTLKQSFVLGSKVEEISKNSRLYKIYKTDKINERHRHQYMFNREYTDLFNENNFNIVSKTQDSNIVTGIELKDHPFYIGVQYHPEFLSRPLRPHPLFDEFIKSVIKNNK